MKINHISCLMHARGRAQRSSVRRKLELEIDKYFLEDDVVRLDTQFERYSLFVSSAAVPRQEYGSIRLTTVCTGSLTTLYKQQTGSCLSSHSKMVRIFLFFLCGRNDDVFSFVY
jgi:hypothetical protein